MFAYLTGAGLSASAGLNAYIPLLIVGGLSGFTDTVALPTGYDWMASWWALAIMTVLLVLELVIDKIALIDHINDLLQTAVRPVAGGAVAAATTTAADLDTATETAVAGSGDAMTGWILGIVFALGVHATKAMLRSMINAGTLGFGTPVVSAAEDTGSAGLSLASIFVPIIAGLALLVMALAIGKLWRARRRWKARRTEAKATKAAAS